MANIKLLFRRLYHFICGHDRVLTFQKKQGVDGNVNVVLSDLACSCGCRKQTTWSKKAGTKDNFRRGKGTDPFTLFNLRTPNSYPDKRIE